MNNLIGTIALAIMLLLLLPANNSSSQTSPPDNLYPARNTAEMMETQSTASQSQSELCPALLELPLMLGRPAPCTRNYSLKK